MKIVLLISAMNTGGAQRVAATLLDAWASRGDEVVLMSTYSGSGGCVFTLHPRVRLVYLAQIVSRPKKSLIGLFQRFLALRRFIINEKPDVVLSFLTSVNVAAILATSALGIPVVVSERINPVAENETSPLWRFLRKITYPHAGAVVVQTRDTVAEFARQIPGMRLSVIPNPLPRQLPLLAAAEPRRSTRKRLVGMGRLESQKGFDVLIRAFGYLHEGYADWDLYIWGEGSRRVELETLIESSGLTGRVFLPGTTNDPWRELAHSDVFVLSSVYEGFPNVLLEAMGLNVACVTFDCPSGPREITRNGKDAILVDRGDLTALSKALERIMGDEALRNRLGAEGGRSVRERYDTPLILAQWEAVFRSVLRARGIDVPAEMHRQ